jgi:hypothetical protein
MRQSWTDEGAELRRSPSFVQRGESSAPDRLREVMSASNVDPNLRHPHDAEAF